MSDEKITIYELRIIGYNTLDLYRNKCEVFWMKIGVMELVVIFIVALLVIGPNKLPEYAKKLGAAMREFKKASAEISKDIREEVIDPLQEAQEPFREIVEPFTELDKAVKGDLNSVTKSFNDLGKSKPKDKKEKAEETAAKETPAEQPEVQEAPVTEAPAAAEPEVKKTEPAAAPVEAEAPVQPVAEPEKTAEE